MTRPRSLLVLLLCLVAAAPATTQQIPGAAPQALVVIRQALRALTGGLPVNDIILQGTVSYTAGSDYQGGTVLLQASGNGKSRLTLNLDGGQRLEVRNGPTGYWVGPDGQQHPMATHNCWTDAPWFYPGLSLQALATDPQVSIVYVGEEIREGVPLLHLRLFRTVPGQTPVTTADIQRLSATDVYLDAVAALPLIVDFSTHPDNDLNLDIPVEIQFGDYRLVNGVKVPFRIRKFLQGSPMLDITLSGGAINSGVPQSDFVVQPIEGGQS
jgi:hypothetical protein